MQWRGSEIQGAAVKNPPEMLLLDLLGARDAALAAS